MRTRFVKLSFIHVSLIGTLLLSQNCSEGFKVQNLEDGALIESSASPLTSTAARPSYNNGTGFFVLNGKLYDANGYEFRIRGMDRAHYDSPFYAQNGITNSNANTVRIFVSTRYGATWSRLAQIIQTQHVGSHQVPVITAPVTTTGTGTSCNTDPAVLNDIVANSWVATASVWTQFNSTAIFNIANEWGPANSTVWRDSYISAIAQMRAAGYTGPLMVDSGGCGQDENNFAQYANDVFQSDPQKNIIFSYHLYGFTNNRTASIQNIVKGKTTTITLNDNSICHPMAPNYCPSLGKTGTYSGVSAYQISGVQGLSQINGVQPAPTNVGGSSGAWWISLNVDSSQWTGNYTGGGQVVDDNGNYALRIARLSALSQTMGAAFVIGEFGPGQNIGPSPTLVDPLSVVSTAESNNLGWMAWAWDDNNLASMQSNNEGFGMTYHSGVYAQSSDLTIFGQQIIEGCLNPNPGGCGCPDNSPLPAYTSTSPPPAIYSAVNPSCTGVANPLYSGLGLKQLAKPATIF
jgi:hypothetical protein